MRLRTNSIANGPHDRDPCPIWGGVITNDMLLFFGAFPQKKGNRYDSIINQQRLVNDPINPKPFTLM